MKRKVWMIHNGRNVSDGLLTAAIRRRWGESVSIPFRRSIRIIAFRSRFRVRISVVVFALQSPSQLLSISGEEFTADYYHHDHPEHDCLMSIFQKVHSLSADNAWAFHVVAHSGKAVEQRQHKRQEWLWMITTLIQGLLWLYHLFWENWPDVELMIINYCYTHRAHWTELVLQFLRHFNRIRRVQMVE